MTTRPTLHVTNWASPLLHGPGHAYTIMAKPRHWERGAGSVNLLVPSTLDLEAVQSGKITLAEYHDRYTNGLHERLEIRCPGPIGYADLATSRLMPGRLSATLPILREDVWVEDGDTLCCACAKANAAKGECHRVWAAAALVRAGWAVILDGKELTP